MSHLVRKIKALKLFKSLENLRGLMGESGKVNFKENDQQLTIAGGCAVVDKTIVEKAGSDVFHGQNYCCPSKESIFIYVFYFLSRLTTVTNPFYPHYREVVCKTNLCNSLQISYRKLQRYVPQIYPKTKWCCNVVTRCCVNITIQL